MARATTKISMYRGDSYPINFTLTDSGSGAPINLTGCLLTLTVDTLSDPPDDSTQLFQLSGVVDADPESGRVAFTPTSGNTADTGAYYYDVQLTDADGNIRTVVKSSFTIAMDITK